MALAGLFFFSLAAWAQTSSISGEVKGEDGKPLKDAWIKIDRTDIKGHYQVKTNKKGEYFHAGLPLGTYNVALEVDGKVRDELKGVRTKLGDPIPVNFDLQGQKKKNDAMQSAASSGQLTKEQERGMSSEQKAALEKSVKEREQSLAKNKALNDSFNTGVESLKAAQALPATDPQRGAKYDEAVASLSKASEMDPKQHVVWAQLADAYLGDATTKTGDEQGALTTKGFDAYGKAIELKPDDAGYHNNYALALARAKKFPEAEGELTKAAQIDPQNAGRYYFNLGALLVNNQQLDAAGDAFKKAIDSDPKYADAYYQYGISLIAKAKYTADGKIIPEPGTKEAFEKYLELKPDGKDAPAAKSMLDTLSGGISTEYKNPDAPATTTKKGAKKK
jgi:tetratricopeptide (TPR) repeat protein